MAGSRSGVSHLTDPNSGRAWLATADDTVLNPTDGTYGDDFNGSSLAAAWTTHNMAGGDILFPGVRGGVMLAMDQTDALLRPAPTGDFEIVAHIRYVAFQGNAIGPCIIDSSGAGVSYSTYDDGNAYIWNLSAYNYSSTGPSHGGAGNRVQDHFLSLRKVGTTYTGRWASAVAGTSPTNPTWASFTSGQTWAGTVDRIGIIRISSNGSKGPMELVRFNVHIPTYTP